MKFVITDVKTDRYFQNVEVQDGNVPSRTENGVINVFDEVEYQSVIGFGGAFTESAAYVYSLLSPEQKKEFMQNYFDREKGIGYNFGRTHINSCDFSLDIYSCVKDGDLTLDSFNIERDKKYVIPFLKDAMHYASEPIVLFATPWSPPAYMKDNQSPIRGGKLKEEFKATWARFYALYIKAMKSEGIEISAITVQNEPIASQPWESCYYSPDDEREFIESYLISALDEAGLSDVKIMIWDHNKERIYDRTKQVFKSAIVKEKVWGVAHHWYSGDHFDGLRLVHEQFGKTIISSENCGSINVDIHGLAERYGKEICGNFNNFASAHCDWNLLLSDQGGPFHNRSEKTVAEPGVVLEDKSKGCCAPVLFDTKTKQLVYTPIYYYIGHFAKYVRKGAVRVATTKYSENIHTCAFKNPDGGVVLIVMNVADESMSAVVRRNDVCTKIDLPAHSIITVLL